MSRRRQSILLPNTIISLPILKNQKVVLRPVADSVALSKTKKWFLSLQLASNASFAKAAEPF